MKNTNFLPYLKKQFGECLMIERIFNEDDIEIKSKGISVSNTFFNKKEIADIFNELVLMRNFIGNQSKK